MEDRMQAGSVLEDSEEVNDILMKVEMKKFEKMTKLRQSRKKTFTFALNQSKAKKRTYL